MKSQKPSKSDALGSNYTLKDGLEECYTVFSNKCILNLSKQPWYTLYLETLYLNDYFLMYTCK